VVGDVEVVIDLPVGTNVRHIGRAESRKSRRDVYQYSRFANDLKPGTTKVAIQSEIIAERT
jgi:hypothetical protein